MHLKKDDDSKEYYMTTQPKNILIFGNIWHGNFAHFLSENLKKLGHSVENINTLYGKNVHWPWQKFQRQVFVKNINLDIQKRIKAGNIDIVIANTPFHIASETWDLIHSKKITTTVWFGDNPMWKQGLLGNIFKYKSIFLPDEEWVAPVKYLNNQTFYLPHAADEDVFYPLIEKTNNPNIDVLFVAHPYVGTSDGVLRATILSALVKAGVRVVLYGGNDWKKLFRDFPLLEKIFIEKNVSATELNVLYNSSKIVLNIHHSQLFTGTNQRTFETGSAGAFQLSDYKKAVVDLHGNDAAVFRSIPEAIEKVYYYLINDRERIAYANRVRDTILNQHTYQHRIETIFKTL